jgi:uncharacterized protein (DUF2249 family)
MNSTIVRLDVREDIRNGNSPLSKIMAAATSLRPGEKLLLIAPFEPVPLVQMLANKGFQHDAHATDSGDWEVMFYRNGSSQQKPATMANSEVRSSGIKQQTSSDVLEVDARGLEPPLPMITILEAVASLPAGSELRGRTDRRPIHLYAQLEERGFVAQTEEQSDGSFITHIRRR